MATLGPIKLFFTGIGESEPIALITVAHSSKKFCGLYESGRILWIGEGRKGLEDWRSLVTRLEVYHTLRTDLARYPVAAQGDASLVYSLRFPKFRDEDSGYRWRVDLDKNHLNWLLKRINIRRTEIPPNVEQIRNIRQYVEEIGCILHSWRLSLKRIPQYCTKDSLEE